MALTSLITSGLTIPPAAAVNAAASVRGLALAAANALIPVTYGVDRQPALLLNILPRADDASQVLVQCLWGHALDGVSELQLNDRPLPAGTTATHYTGGQTTPDALLVAAFAAQGITYTDALTGYAYSVVALPTARFDGQLNLSARLRGRRVYSRRLDSTAGGSGPHRLNDPATWEWSDNPSDCLADWISNTAYGAGEPVDWATVPAAANANDALVGSPGERRRVLGLTLNRDGVSIATVAESLRVYAGVWLVPGAAGLRLVPDAPDVAGQAYTHAAGQIAALEGLRLKDLGDAPTAMEVLYTDTTATPWRERSVVVPLPGAGTSLPWRLSSIRLPGVQRYSQARREAIERLNKLNARALECSLEVFDVGIRHDVADIISVTHPVGLTAKPMRVTDVLMSGPGRWLLQLREHEISSYSDEVLPAPGTSDTDRSILDGPSSAVAGLAGSVNRGRITWRWEPCPDPGYGYTEVRTSNANWGSLSPAPLFRGAASQYQETVLSSGTYTRWVRHFGTRGNPSATAVSAEVTVASSDLILTVVDTDTETLDGASYSALTAAHTWSITPELDCKIDFLATVWAESIITTVGPGNRLSWYVTAGSGTPLFLGGSFGNGSGRQQIVCSASFTAAAGVPLTFVLQAEYVIGDPIRLWDSRMKAVQLRNAAEVPAPPPPPPPGPPPSPGGFWISHWMGAVVFTAGQSGTDVTTELLAAAAQANALGYWLDLPPWSISFRRAFKCNKIRGVRGKSRLVPLAPFDYSPTFASEFILTNVNVDQGFNEATADDVVYRDFEINLTPTVSNAMIGMLGIKRGLFTGLRLIANRNVVSGKAVPVGSLLDLYCTNRNVDVTDNYFDNTTGAYGNDGPIGPDGGACMWVRNLRGGTVGQAEAFASENIKVHHNTFRHMSSDECFAIFGTRGIVRKVQVHNNTFVGLPSVDLVHHASFISCFPLDDGSALGATAAVYDNDIFDNDIEDAAAMYDVLRVGKSSDASRLCFNNRSRGNRVRWIRSNNPTTGPKAVWLSLGSPGGPSSDPDIVSAIIRCVEGNFGQAYFSDSSGNTSTDDVAICQGGGATSAAGFSGWQKLVNPTAYGDIFNVAFQCRMVEGGTLEGFARIFYNCQKVNGTRYRKNGAGGVVFEVDSGAPGTFTMTNTEGETFGAFVKVAGSVPSNTIVNAFGNVCAMSGGASYWALENQSGAGALLIARNNTTRGAIAGPATGAGPVERSGNYWSALPTD